MKMDDHESSQDDSAMPTQSRPMVHFNLAPPIPRKRTAIKILDSNVDDSLNDISYQDRDMESFEIFTNEPTNMSPIRHSAYRGIYPEMPRAKPMPAPRSHIFHSTGNLIESNDEIIVNPRSYHKGLLRVVSSTNISTSKIPRRMSNSMGNNKMRTSSSSLSLRRDSLKANQIDGSFRNRTHSASPRRRSSMDVNGSMIDLGVTPTRSSKRISKPTTLSPIVGTPNKDSTLEDESYSSSSPTKIPIRRNSNVNIHSRMRSRSNSQSESRESSPPKPPSRPSQTKIPQKLPMRTSPAKNNKTMTPNSQRKLKPSDKKSTKETSTIQKEPGISRQSSSVKKPPPSTIKREPSTLKRTPSTLKREASNKSLKREKSMISLTGGGTSGSATNKKTLAGTATMVALLKNQSDSSLAKRLEKNKSFKHQRTSSESDGLNEIDTANTSDNLIPLTASNINGSISTTVIASQPVQITAAVTSQLNKTNSSGQIVNNVNTNSNMDNVTSENGVKNKETPKKITTSTDTNIVKGTSTKTTMIENAGDSMINAAVEIIPTMAAGAATTIAPLVKTTSTKSLGTKIDAVPMVTESMQNVPMVAETTDHIASAIETNVNVIEPDEAATSDSSPHTVQHTSMMKLNSNEPSVHTPASNLEMGTTNVVKQTDKLGQSSNGISTPNDQSANVMGQM